MVDTSDRKRLLFISVFFSILFCSLIVRFYQIQIVQGDQWRKVALAQHQYVATEPFMRGSFYSNTSIKKGHPEEPVPFVIDVMKFHLFIDPDSIPPHVKEKMAKELKERFGIEGKEEFYKKSRSRKLVSWLERDERQKIEEWWGRFYKKEKVVRNALYFTSEYKRSYPFGPMLGAVLHTVQDEKDPKNQQALPTGGLEMLYHSYLKGKLGKREIVRSPLHPIDGGKIIEKPENGADVYLTINHYLQAVAESELEKGVAAAKAKGGWAVMMDPYTGEILALAQSPSFHPARYWEYYNDPSLVERTKVHAVADCFEPGSIFKPVTVAICLKASEELKKKGGKGFLSPDEWVPTTNGWFPGRSKPLKDKRTHQALNLDLAMQKSSNVYMARIAQRMLEKMGDQWYRNALLETFGFGTKTGIELPAESSGNVPTPGKLHPNGRLEWSVPTPYSLSIGHNILVNSIQLIRSYAIFANGGYLIRPHLVRKIVRKKEGGAEEVLVDNTGLGRMQQVLSSSICSAVVRSMKFVTKEGGTSKRGDIPGYTEAGKSGTAEKILDGVYSKDHNISSFVGFAPANNPRFVLLVTLDDPEKRFVPGVGSHQYGGVCAAPIFREIAVRSLQYLGVAPDDPYGYPPGDPRRDPKRADWVAEVENLKQAYMRHNP